MCKRESKHKRRTTNNMSAPDAATMPVSSQYYASIMPVSGLYQAGIKNKNKAKKQAKRSLYYAGIRPVSGLYQAGIKNRVRVRVL